MNIYKFTLLALIASFSYVEDIRADLKDNVIKALLKDASRSRKITVLG